MRWLATFAYAALALAAFGLMLAQLFAGFAGIELHLGAFWAWLAIAAAFVARLYLPVTIGAFFGARDVWGWHWPLALLFALPGLALVLPGLLVGVLAMCTRALAPHRFLRSR
jgi:hypothetical protein